MPMLTRRMPQSSEPSQVAPLASCLITLPQLTVGQLEQSQLTTGRQSGHWTRLAQVRTAAEVEGIRELA
eukprot:1238893-Pyramimonas_sp.AAC.1